MKPSTKLTLEQYLAQPETEPASEFVCGEVIQKPMPDLPHSLIQDFIQAMLRAFVRPRRLGRSGAELRCVFGPPGEERGYVPDVVFISRERLPRGDVRDAVPLRVAPDLAVEILSPDQDIARFVEKIVFSLRHGVRLVWIVDPRTETVTLVSPTADPVVLGVADTLDGGEVLPGFSVAIADIFAELRT